MERIYGTCCGLDVHKKLIVACVTKGTDRETREFGASTRQLTACADWLAEEGCEMVAMESTGSYWKPVYNILEACGVPAMVVNARHCKAVPGRKSDANDAEWLADLVQHGLLNPSFIPPKPQRELRELEGLRKSFVEERARDANRIQKVLEGANIKLSGTVSDVTGMSGLALIEAAISECDLGPDSIEAMREAGAVSRRLKATNEQLAEDLQGELSNAQRRMLRELIDHIGEIDAHIANIDEEVGGLPGDDERAAVEAISEIPGIAETSARTIISVIGTDMRRFRSDGCLCAWGGLAPGQNESAKKRGYCRTRKGNQLLKTTLVNAAHSAANAKGTFFAAKYQRIKARRGAKRAYVAVARAMLTAIYRILKEGVPYRELGASHYDGFDRERAARSYARKLAKLGYEIELPQPVPVPA